MTTRGQCCNKPHDNLVEDLKKGGSEIQPLGEENSNEDKFGYDFEGDSPVQSCDDLGDNSHDLPNMVTEAEINLQTKSARYESFFKNILFSCRCSKSRG